MLHAAKTYRRLVFFFCFVRSHYFRVFTILIIVSNNEENMYYHFNRASFGLRSLSISFFHSRESEIVCLKLFGIGSVYAIVAIELYNHFSWLGIVFGCIILFMQPTNDQFRSVLRKKKGNV